MFFSIKLSCRENRHSCWGNKDDVRISEDSINHHNEWNHRQEQDHIEKIQNLPDEKQPIEIEIFANDLEKRFLNICIKGLKMNGSFPFYSLTFVEIVKF